MVHQGNSAEAASVAPSLVVFDVGGVFVDLDLDARNRLLAAGGKWTAEASADPALVAANLAFRLGQIGDDVYVDRVSGIYGLTRHEIYRAETALLRGVLPEMVDYVPALKKRHRVVCLSNTQAIHWRHIIRRMLGEDFFDACYLSHEMGMEKPHAEIYRELERREGVSGRDIVFVDDTAGNVEAARALGWMHSIHHRSATRTVALIESLLDCGVAAEQA